MGAGLVPSERLAGGSDCGGEPLKHRHLSAAAIDMIHGTDGQGSGPVMLKPQDAHPIAANPLPTIVGNCISCRRRIQAAVKPVYKLFELRKLRVALAELGELAAALKVAGDLRHHPQQPRSASLHIRTCIALKRYLNHDLRLSICGQRAQD